MRKRSTTTRKKSSAEDYLKTPPTAAEASPKLSASKSPMPFDFNFSAFHATSLTPPNSAEASPNLSASKPPMPFDFKFSAFNATSLTPPSSSKKRLAGQSSRPIRPSTSPVPMKNCKTIADLKDFASSGLDSIKHQLDCSHSEILKDIEASHSRFHKRLKIQTQACQQMTDEAEKEHKKMSERIDEGREAMKASYTEFMAEVQANASRFCKTSIPELLKSVEKSIESLRSRYGVPSTSAC